MRMCKSDRDSLNYSAGTGEFSIYNEDAFEKHLKRLNNMRDRRDEFYQPYWYHSKINLVKPDSISHSTK